MRYPKECVLKECQEATIRPLEREDEWMLTQFYGSIPEPDRWYMRYDVSNPQVVRKWIESIESATVTSIIATCGTDRIIGHGSLHMRDFGSTRHVGRFRILIHPDFRQQRLGTWMLLDLIQLAMDKGLQELRVDLVVGPEDAAIDAVRKFDFFRRAVLPNYAKDPDGSRHDMVIMIKRLHKDWGDF